MTHVKILFATMENSHFYGANLDSADLGNSDLRGSNFSQCSMRETAFYGTDMRRCNFWAANLTGAEFHISQNMTGGYSIPGQPSITQAIVATRLDSAFLRQSILDSANLLGADFIGADLMWASLKGARVRPEQLLSVASLYGAELDSEIKQQIVIWKPELFDQPDWLELP
jgi:uncharacterized protein YjbI with pentapeptide repeats